MPHLGYSQIFAVTIAASFAYANSFSEDAVASNESATDAMHHTDYKRLNMVIEGFGTLVVSIDGKEEVHNHTGICDQWADDVAVYVLFQSDEANVHVHEIITDDPNIAWSGPENSGWTLGDNAYELVPVNAIVTDSNTTSGSGTATIVNLEDGTRGEISTMKWSVTCE